MVRQGEVVQETGRSLIYRTVPTPVPVCLSPEKARRRFPVLPAQEGL